MVEGVPRPFPAIPRPFSVEVFEGSQRPFSFMQRLPGYTDGGAALAEYPVVESSPWPFLALPWQLSVGVFVGSRRPFSVIRRLPGCTDGGALLKDYPVAAAMEIPGCHAGTLDRSRYPDQVARDQWTQQSQMNQMNQSQHNSGT